MIKTVSFITILLGFLISSCSEKSAGTSTNTGTTIAASDSTIQTDEPLTITILDGSTEGDTLHTNQIQSNELQTTELPKNESFKLKLHYEFRRAFDYNLKDGRLEASLIDSGTILNNNIFWNNDSLDYPCVLTLSTNLGQKHLSQVFYNLKDLQNSPDLFSLKDTTQIQVNPIKTPSDLNSSWVGFLGSSSFVKLSQSKTLISPSFSDMSKLIVFNDLENPSIASFNPKTEASPYLIPTQTNLEDSLASLKFSTNDNLDWEIEFTILP